MKFTQVAGQKIFRKWTQWKAGDSVVGKLVGTSEDNYGKTNFEIEVIEVDFQGATQPNIGEILVLNSNGSLDASMEKITTGDVFKVVYGGKDVLKKGKYAGKEFHKLSVFKASDSSPKIEDSGDLDSL